MTAFDPTGAILAYLHARGSAPEADIIRAVEAREEEAHGDGSYAPTDVPRLLFDLVERGCLRWRKPLGGDGGGTKSLVYSIRAVAHGGVS